MHSDARGSTRAPTEVLIPEARQHQRRRYFRAGIVAALCGLLVAALISFGAVLVTGQTAGGGSHPASAAPSVGVGRVPFVFFRPVLCYAPPYRAAAGTSSTTTPVTCTAASELTPGNLHVEPTAYRPGVEPQSGAGFTMNNVPPDSALAGAPSTRWSEDKATSTVLLPGLRQTNPGPRGTLGTRFVLGPAEMTSSSVGSAVAHRIYPRGPWVVEYTMRGPRGSALLDKVARENFHQLLGIDFHGVVVSAPVIQPTQSSYSSFRGRGEIGGNLTKAEATALARAFTTHR
jgi:hypothetical protein